MLPKGVMLFADADPQTCSRAGTRITALEYAANRPIAHHVLDALGNAGVGEVLVIAPSELLTEVRQYLDAYGLARGLKLEYVVHALPLDMGQALKAAAPIVGSAPCIVHLANGLLGAASP
jgi:dTDP-glucose pyrophosphorylase